MRPLVIKTKLLGVRLDNLLTWSDCIDYIVSKMEQGIVISRKCSAYVLSSVMINVFRSPVLSHLLYCLVLWLSAAERYYILTSNCNKQSCQISSPHCV